MNEQQLQEIKERAKKAMSAPWHTNSKNEILIEDDGRLGKMIRRYEAEFIVHAREDVPALVVEIERLQNTIALHEVNKRNLDAMIEHKDAEIERLRKALEFYADESNYNKITLSVRIFNVLLDKGEIARKALEGESNAI